MKATQRLYRTTDGELVPEGNLKAAFLAYAVGDEIAAEDAKKVPGTKSSKPAANKMADKPEDKSAAEAPKPPSRGRK